MLTKPIKQIDEIISSLNFKETNLLKNLKEQPKVTIFLTGKSGSGKTTLLNAILELDNEFYTSTKVATKTQFRITYGDFFEYSFSDSMYQKFSSDCEERKQKMSEINKSEKVIYIHHPSPFLKDFKIIDIPGFFDFDNKNEYMDEIFSETDLVVFLKNYKDMLTPEENVFLKELQEQNILYCVLFTQIDISNRAEGLTRNTIPDFVKKRVVSYGKFFNYFLVSAKNDKSTVDSFKEFILNHTEYIQDYSTKSKTKRTVNYYIKLIENEREKILNEINISLEKDIDIFESKQNEKLMIQDEMIEKFAIESEREKDDFIQNAKRLLDSNKNVKEKLEELWNSFWNNIISLINFSYDTPTIPVIIEDLFENIKSIDDFLIPTKIKKICFKTEEKIEESKKNKKGKKEEEDKSVWDYLENLLADEELSKDASKFLKVWLKRQDWLNHTKRNIEINLENIKQKMIERRKLILVEFDRNTAFNQYKNESEIPTFNKAITDLKKINVTS